jgi:alpha-beta hydrolase superfamily lysophospholipase
VNVHRRTLWRKDPGGTPYRTRRSFPAGPASATVLLAGPGTVSALDGEGRDDLLLGELTRHLVAGGAQVLSCDMPARDPNAPSTEADQDVRAARLAQLLAAHGHMTARPLVLLGFSLGGQALLRLLRSGRPQHAERVVLVGTVVEEDVFLSSRIASLDLVYGSFDLVGYVGDSDDAGVPPAVFGPDMYGHWSAGRLVGRSSLDVRVHLLEGLGHTLHPCGSGPSRDPVAALTSLTGTAL